MKYLVYVLTLAVATSAGCSSLLNLTGGETTNRAEAPSDVAVQADAAESEATIAALRRMADFLATQSSLRFEAEISYDVIQNSGQKIEFGNHRKVSLRRPDGAQFTVSHWQGVRELLTFDGNRLSAAIPDEGVYASMAFSGSVGEALDYLVAEYGIAAPLSDLLRREFADDVASRMHSAERIGEAAIGGVPCQHLAFHGERVDFQIYIRQGDEPVPMRFLIDYHSEPGRPQFRAALMNWELSPDLPDSTFRLRPPSGAQHVDFDELLELLDGPIEQRMEAQ